MPQISYRSSTFPIRMYSIAFPPIYETEIWCLICSCEYSWGMNVWWNRRGRQRTALYMYIFQLGPGGFGYLLYGYIPLIDYCCTIEFLHFVGNKLLLIACGGSWNDQGCLFFREISRNETPSVWSWSKWCSLLQSFWGSNPRRGP